MAGEDYIKLPNGKKIYIKDTYGKVSENDVNKKTHAFSIFRQFDSGCDGKLTSDEVKSVFNSLKECANQDGNNELSEAELNDFIRKNIDNEYILSLVNPKEVLKLLTDIQKISEKSLRNSDKAKAGNTTNEIFPELSKFGLGKDNNIDVKKLSSEELKKHYPPEKYDIIETKKTEYISETPEGHRMSSEHEFPGSKPVEYSSLVIISKETGRKVLSKYDSKYVENGFNVEIADENSDRKIKITAFGNGDMNISSEDYKSTVNINQGRINYAYDHDNYTYFDDGIITLKRTKTEEVTYKNGKPDKTKKLEQPRESYREYKAKHTDSSSILEKLVKECTTEELIKYIEKSVKNNDIGLDADNYYALTGRELTDDIKNSNLPDGIKEKLINEINGVFADSKYYDAHKRVDNARIQNDYYTSSDEYSVEYNGAVINIHNKTTGKKTRINLRTLLKDYDLSSKKVLHQALQYIQSYPPEMLENIAVELEYIMTLTDENASNGYDSVVAAAFYSGDAITDGTSMQPRIIAHELAHAMDNEGGSTGFSSAKGRFMDVYNDCIKRYEAKGNKRFDRQNPEMASNRGRGVFGKKVHFKGNNYATYNHAEAFAISVQILMGYEDAFTEFIHDQMPELIDAARELYEKIRKRPQEQRRKI